MTLSFCFMLPKRSSTCTTCSHKFQADENVFSSLKELKMEWQRFDLCQNCFKNKPETSSNRWVCQIVKVEHEQKQTGMELLLELVSSQEISIQQEASVLAMILLRQKILIERKKEVKQGETAYTLYECRATGELFLIPNLTFTPQTLKDVHTRLEEKCRLRAT